MRMFWPVVAILACATACSDREDQPTQSSPAEDAASFSQEDASSSTVFDIHPDERPALEERAVAGDAEASFRIAQYYTFASTGAASDAANERRWLELATQQGHRVAKHNLAVLIAAEDCRRAVSMMRELVESAPTPEDALSAESWLNDPSFQC